MRSLERRRWSALLLAALLSMGIGGAQAPSQLRDRWRQTIHTARAPRVGRTVTLAGIGESEPAVYHYGPTLVCSDCHVMHGLPTGEAFPMLLRRDSALALCLLCHDGVPGIPDVVGPDTNDLAQRAAGAFADPGVWNPNGHNLGVGADDVCLLCHTGGDMLAVEVTCVDCHNPHGNGRPRNLQWASWPAGTPQLGLFINPGATGLDRYEAAEITYGTDGTDALREVTNICLDCHHVFSGEWYTGPNPEGSYYRHPVSESERNVACPIAQGVADGGSDPLHWLNGVGAGFDVPRLRFVGNPATNYAQASVVSGANNVFCLTCHRAHGSEFPFSLAWPPNPGGVGPGGCDQCHNKSGG